MGNPVRSITSIAKEWAYNSHWTHIEVNEVARLCEQYSVSVMVVDVYSIGACCMHTMRHAVIYTNKGQDQLHIKLLQGDEYALASKVLSNYTMPCSTILSVC